MVIGAVESNAVVRAVGEVSDFTTVTESVANRSRAVHYGGSNLLNTTKQVCHAPL